MRHFYRLADGIPVVAFMTRFHEQREVLSNRDEGVSWIEIRSPKGDSEGATVFPVLKRTALTILTMAEGSQLGACALIALDAKSTISNEAEQHGWSRFVLVLQGNPKGMMLIGDESITMRTGEIWWIDSKAPGQIINNGDDDLVLFLVDVVIDK